MLFTFLLVVHGIIAFALVTVILMQRSEGGGLGMGGSPSGLMSARGAADFLTRATTVLASAFVAMSIGLAALASYQRGPRAIDTSLARPAPASQTPASDVPLAGDPLAPVAGAVSTNPGPVTPEAPAGETVPVVRPPAAQSGPGAGPAVAAKPVTKSAAATTKPASRPASKAEAPAAIGTPAPAPANATAPAPITLSPPAPKVPEPVQEKAPGTTSSGNAATPQ